MWCSKVCLQIHVRGFRKAATDSTLVGGGIPTSSLLNILFLIICCEYSFGGLLILPYLKHLETTGLEESSFLVLVHHPFHNKNKSPSSPQTKHCWFQPIKNKLPRYLIHPQIFDSPPLSKSCWTSSATQGSLPQLPILASQWVIISSLPSRELRISNLSPILESMAISGS